MYPIHYLSVHTVLMLTKHMIQLRARNSILRFYGGSNLPQASPDY